MNTMLNTGTSLGTGTATALLAAKNDYAAAVNYHKNKEAAEGKRPSSVDGWKYHCHHSGWFQEETGDIVASSQAQIIHKNT